MVFTNLQDILEFITKSELVVDSEDWAKAYNDLIDILYGCSRISEISIERLVDKLDAIDSLEC